MLRLILGITILFALAATGLGVWGLLHRSGALDQALSDEDSQNSGQSKSDQPGSPSTAPRPVGHLPASDAQFVGSAECQSCHADFHAKWADSWHGQAMRPYTPQLARENLVPHVAGIAIRGRTYQARIGQDSDAVVETGPEGAKTYPIQHVLGGKNVLYFLTPFHGGRLQVLPLAFDTRKREWYDTTGSMVRHARQVGNLSRERQAGNSPRERQAENLHYDEPIEWTDRLLTFNAACQGCHVSQLAKNYSLETDTYQTTWREPGINCESCHGPGRKHVDRMTARAKPGRKDPPEPGELDIILTGSFTSAQMNSLCAQCHAKLTPLTEKFQPGEEFFDHFRLALLEDLDFYPDGRDLGENFTHTSWLMSPCSASSTLGCTHCHTSSGKNKFQGAEADRACTPCHVDYVATAAAHSHHKAGSEGARCVACHMPQTSFARMRRHDHSMLPPAPAATLKFRSPNACNLCHTDQDAQWADQWVRTWYPRDYQAPMVYRGELIDAARKADWKRLDEMVAYVTGESDRGRGASAGAAGGLPPSAATRNEVFAASLLRLMERSPQSSKWRAYFKAIEDRSPLVRSAAAAGLAWCPDPKTLETLSKAASDRCRLVRVDAGAALAHRPDFAGATPAPRAAIAEYLASLRSRLDDPWSHYNLGNYYLDSGDPPAAIAEYEIASRLDSTLVPVLVNLSIAQARIGERQKAEAALRRALKHAPLSAEANLNLGLLLGESGRQEEAIACLRAAWKADPQLAQAAYNLAVLLSGKDLNEAIDLCRKAAELRPDEPKYAVSLAIYLHQSGDRRGAIAVLRGLLARVPDDAEAAELLRELQR